MSCTRKWSSNELNLLSANYVSNGYSSSEVECLVEKTSQQVDPNDYFNTLEKIKKGEVLSKAYVDRATQIEADCVPRGYTNSFKTRVVRIFVSKGLSESVGTCVMGKIMEKYSFEQYMQEEKSFYTGEPSPTYIAFMTAIERDCKNQ